jgi:hypothetical protein
VVKGENMKLSNQALGALMLALQESLMNQTDIVPILQGFELEETGDGLVIKNPPIVHVPNTATVPAAADTPVVK